MSRSRRDLATKRRRAWRQREWEARRWFVLKLANGWTLRFNGWATSKSFEGLTMPLVFGDDPGNTMRFDPEAWRPVPSDTPITVDLGDPSPRNTWVIG